MNNNEEVHEELDDDMPVESDISQMKNGVRGKYYARMREGAKMMNIDDKYPNIAEWVLGGARIELGNDDNTPVLARAIDGRRHSMGRRRALWHADRNA